MQVVQNSKASPRTDRQWNQELLENPDPKAHQASWSDHFTGPKLRRDCRSSKHQPSRIEQYYCSRRNGNHLPFMRPNGVVPSNSGSASGSSSSYCFTSSGFESRELLEHGGSLVYAVTKWRVNTATQYINIYINSNMVRSSNIIWVDL